MGPTFYMSSTDEPRPLPLPLPINLASANKLENKYFWPIKITIIIK